MRGRWWGGGGDGQPSRDVGLSVRVKGRNGKRLLKFREFLEIRADGPNPRRYANSFGGNLLTVAVIFCRETASTVTTALASGKNLTNLSRSRK